MQSDSRRQSASAAPKRDQSVRDIDDGLPAANSRISLHDDGITQVFGLGGLITELRRGMYRAERSGGEIVFP